MAVVQGSTGCTPGPPTEPDDSIYMRTEQETGRIRTIVTFLVVLWVRGHDGCGVS